MRVSEILAPSRVVLDLAGKDKKEILQRLSAPVVTDRPNLDADDLVAVLLEREKASSTAIADGIAIPHGKVDLGEEVVAVFGRAANGLDFESVDGQPTRIFFLLVSPKSHPSLHLRWLAHIAGLLKNPEFRADILAAATPEDVLARIEKEESRGKESEGAGE
jgi:PTS system nitrogen regulatory IIA component